MVSVQYHRDDNSGAKLSLWFVNEDRNQVLDVAADRRTSTDSPLQEYRSKVEECTETSPTTYLLYEAQLYPRGSWEVDNILSGLSDEREAIAVPIIDAFQEIVDDWEQDGKEVKWYKAPEIDKVFSALDAVDFGEPIPVVGGQILSNLITEHPLPNANHRIAMSFLEMYLSTYEPEFELPNTGITGQWEDWAKEFVYESKCIMTLSRKCGLLRTLEEYGCTEVVRDGGNVITFEDYDLSRSDYTDYYQNKVHLEQSIGFVHGVLDRTNNPELLSMEDNGRDEFVDALLN